MLPLELPDDLGPALASLTRLRPTFTIALVSAFIFIFTRALTLTLAPTLARS